MSNFDGIVFKAGGNMDALKEFVLCALPIAESASYDHRRIIALQRISIAQQRGIVTDDFVLTALDILEHDRNIVGI